MELVGSGHAEALDRPWDIPYSSLRSLLPPPPPRPLFASSRFTNIRVPVVGSRMAVRESRGSIAGGVGKSKGCRGMEEKGSGRTTILASLPG